MKPNAAKVNGQIRHLVGTMGTFLVSMGYATETQSQMYVGLVLAVLPFIQSFFADEKK